MNIKECIDRVDSNKPNQYTLVEKIGWINFIEEKIINDILKTHEGYDGRYDLFEGYTDNNLTAELVAPSPYDRLYTAYLKMKIDEENGETTRYNNSAAMFNAYYTEYKKWYNKHHMPIVGKKKTVVVPTTAKVGLTDAEFEALVRELTYTLTKEFAGAVSEDKIYDIVMRYMQNNTELFRGEPGKDGKQGEAGKDGYSPIKGIDYNDGKPGKDGEDGVDGYSPIVTVTETDNGHTVSIRDRYGVHTFDVVNGASGDWNQNDERKADYIKNRTHYEETVLIGEGTATGDWSIIPLSQSFDWGNASIFVDGREVDYTISDNREFEDLIIVEAESTHQILHYYGASAKPLKITITSWTPAGTHIQIYQNSVKTLDEKYIPESIARVSDVNEKIGDIGEVLDELHNYAQTLLGGDA